MPHQTINLQELLDGAGRRAAPTPKPLPSKARLRAIIETMLSLKMEALALYRSLPESELFHASLAKTRLAEGSNRSSKTISGAIEIARAVTRCCPYNKYPRTGTIIIVGLKEDNIAMIWRKLCEPGAFSVIQDEHTRMWRSVRPDPNDPLHLDPYDLAYRERWKDAPPLIPRRYLPLDRVAWTDARNQVPRSARLLTDWRIEFRPSGSKPDQGDHFNIAWNDEEMEKPDWYYEEIRGLVGTCESPEYTPRMFWTATSQVANPEFAELREQALAGAADVARFVFLIKDNPYVSDEEKQRFYDRLPESERQTRYHGIPSASMRAIYPTYEPMGIHGCERIDPLPRNWCRYVIVDPGTGILGTMIIAIDPDEKHCYMTDAWTMKKVSVGEWAYTVKEREHGQKFEAIIIDDTAAKMRCYNNLTTTAEQFWEALEKAEVIPRQYGPRYGLFPAVNDVKVRTVALNTWLAIRQEGPFRGTPIVQVFRGACPDLDKQIRNAVTSLKDPEKRLKDTHHACDLLDDLEYAAAAKLRYYAPENTIAPEKKINLVYQEFLRHERKSRRSLSASGTLG